MIKEPNPFIHPLPKDIEIIHGRHPFIVNYCKGKNVLHIGCVDSGLMKERFEVGDLLHQKLDSVCTSLWGIDIDEPGLEFLRQKGYKNLLFANIEKESDLVPIKDIGFDVIILSEVIEHLPNIGLAFNALRSIASHNKTEFLISVPNAFSLPVLEALLDNNEFVHPDHNYYFSYITLNTVLSKLGYSVKKRYLYTFQPLKSLPSYVQKSIQSTKVPSSNTITSRNPIKKWYWQYKAKTSTVPFYKMLLCKYLFSRSPYWADGIMYICKIQKHVL